MSNGNCSSRKSFGNAISEAFKNDGKSQAPATEKHLVNGLIPGTDSKYIIHESPIKQSPIKASPIPNGHTNKASKKDKHKKVKSKIESDSNHNSVEDSEAVNIPKLAEMDGKVDSAIDEVFIDSDGSDTPVHHVAVVQEVEVQIEEVTRQTQLPSISQSLVDDTDEVVMRRKFNCLN